MVLGGVNLAIWLPRFVTADADYCLTCHATGETPTKGNGSMVHPGYGKVSCVDCHAKPGQVIYVEGYRGGFSASPSEVSDNCVRCHESIIGKNDEAGFLFNELDIRIPHQKHVAEIGAKCTDCHRNVAHDYSVEPNSRPLMEYCEQCHSKKESCSLCHPSGLPKNWTVRDQKVPLIAAGTYPPVIKHSLVGRSDCRMCHGAQIEGIPHLADDHEGRDNSTCRWCHLEQTQ